MTKKRQRGRPPLPGRPLSLKELDHLDDLLAGRKIGCPGIEQLDGYLAAILSGPALIPPSQALGYILGEVSDPSRPSFESMEESERLINLIMRHWNAIAAGLLRGDYPPSLTAYDGHAFGINWCRGFLDGTKLWNDAWLALLADPSWQTDLDGILALAAGLAGLDDATRKRYLDSLGPIAVDIRHHFLDAPAPPTPLAMEPDPAGGWPITDDVPPHWEVGWIPVPGRIESEPDARLVAVLSQAGSWAWRPR